MGSTIQCSHSFATFRDEVGVLAMLRATSRPMILTSTSVGLDAASWEIFENGYEISFGIILATGRNRGQTK